MTIEWRQGDMFASGADALVCAANARGILGAGQALEVSRRYPLAAAEFRGSKTKRPGKLLCASVAAGEPLIVFACVKDNPYEPSRLEWIGGCAAALARGAFGRSVAVPALGCGLGGLSWTDVRPILERMAEAAPDVRWLIYEPREGERMDVARAIAARLTRRGLRANAWQGGHRVRVYLASETEGREGGRLGGVRLGWIEVDDQMRLSARGERDQVAPDAWLADAEAARDGDLGEHAGRDAMTQAKAIMAAGPTIPSVQRIHDAHAAAVQRHGMKGFPRGPAR